MLEQIWWRMTKRAKHFDIMWRNFRVQWTFAHCLFVAYNGRGNKQKCSSTHFSLHLQSVSSSRRPDENCCLINGAGWSRYKNQTAPGSGTGAFTEWFICRLLASQLLILFLRLWVIHDWSRGRHKDIKIKITIKLVNIQEYHIDKKQFVSWLYFWIMVQACFVIDSSAITNI